MMCSCSRAFKPIYYVYIYMIYNTIYICMYVYIYMLVSAAAALELLNLYIKRDLLYE